MHHSCVVGFIYETCNNILSFCFFPILICCVGCKRVEPCWVYELADLALGLPDTCRELEEQVLRGSQLGDHVSFW